MTFKSGEQSTILTLEGPFKKTCFGLFLSYKHSMCFKGVASVTRLLAFAHQRHVPTPDRSVSEDTQRM
jgi:hypothetical protein